MFHIILILLVLIGNSATEWQIRQDDKMFETDAEFEAYAKTVPKSRVIGEISSGTTLYCIMKCQNLVDCEDVAYTIRGTFFSLWDKSKSMIDLPFPPEFRFLTDDSKIVCRCLYQRAIIKNTTSCLLHFPPLHVVLPLDAPDEK